MSAPMISRVLSEVTSISCPSLGLFRTSSTSLSVSSEETVGAGLPMLSVGVIDGFSENDMATGDGGRVPVAQVGGTDKLESILRRKSDESIAEAQV